MRFWLGALTATLTFTAIDQVPDIWHETFVQTVEVELLPDLWAPDPLDMDVEEHAQCMIDLLNHLGLEITVQNLFIVGDFADLQGGPCGLLP